MGKNHFYCPLCNAELSVLPGTKLNPKDGVTMYCPSAECPAQEVVGHGDNEMQAFRVIQEKYKKSN